jgi:Ras-related protein Rab-1A
MILRYCENSFATSSHSTIGVDFNPKEVPIDGITRTVQIFDTAGQERYRSISESYYRRAHGIIVVFDVSALPTFETLKTWISSVQAHARLGTPFIVCGNKCDLKAEVRVETADDFARSMGSSLFLTSAANGEGIEDAFEAIIKLAVPGADAARGGETVPALAENVERKRSWFCRV